MLKINGSYEDTIAFKSDEVEKLPMHLITLNKLPESHNIYTFKVSKVYVKARFQLKEYITINIFIYLLYPENSVG